MIFRLITFIFIFLLSFNVNGQFERYSIDNEKLHKSGKIDLKFRIEQQKKKKEERKESKEFYKQQRLDKKARKRYRKDIQTRKVRKRMKKSERIAKKNNKNKPLDPFYVRLWWKIENFYGRLH